MSNLKITCIQDEVIIEGGTAEERQQAFGAERDRVIADAERFSGYFKGYNVQRIGPVGPLTKEGAEELLRQWREKWNL